MRPNNTLSRAYREISERHLLAANAVLQAGLQEIAIFHCYHAFESIACAALCLRTTQVPVTHRAKIEHFIRAYKHGPFTYGVTALAPVIGPMRNRALYPTLGAAIREPNLAFTVNDARNLYSRVDGLVRLISASLGI
jgi:hypothetical protein